MKELDNFTVERLTELSTRENLPEVAALARIALAAKTAEPVAWWTGPEPTLTGEIESIHDHETGGHYLPLISIGTTSEAGLSREKFIFKVANFLCTRRQSIAREAETASMIYDMVNPQGIEKHKTSIRDGILKLREHAELLGGYDHGALADELSAPVLNSPELPDGWIKCSEELPPEGYEEDGGSVSVLVWYKDKPDCGHPYGISNVFFVRKHWEKWYTHWQPLPAPPTTEK